MIRSMTGFGEASGEFDGVQYFVELRTLNNKYLKTVIRLPEEYQGLEAELEAALRARLTRGTATLTGTCLEVSESAAREVNIPALEKYLEQIYQAPLVAKGQAVIDVGALLSLPGVLQPPANEEERLDRARKAFLELLDRASVPLIQMRRDEGRRLLEELLRQRDVVLDRLGLVMERAPAVAEEYEKRLMTRIDRLLQQADLKADPVDILKEVAAYAERTDINEEISRLSGHMDQFAQLLDADESRPVGRTLEFLSQEMLREANTIASKSPDADISRAIIEVKGAIDRIKELVLNVE